MKISGLFGLGGAALVIACGSDPTSLDFDPVEYHPIPAIEDLDWSAIDPAIDWDYWEIRSVGPGMDHVLLGAGGRLEREELEAATLSVLEATSPPTGFGAGCLPGTCYRYVVAVEQGDLTTITTRAGLADFLGGTGSAAEAILLVSARPYTFWDQGENTGIRARDGAWDIVVLEMVAFCAPVQTDRVRFRVLPDGRVVIRARELWERSENACV